MDQTKRSRAEAWLRYVDDLGIGPYYLDRAARTTPDFSGAPSSVLANAGASDEISTPAPTSSPAIAAAAAPKRAPDPAPPVIQRATGTSLFESADRIEGDTLERIRTDITPTCTRCKLHKARKQIVFGVGNPKAQLVFVGEGPGRDEDEQGEPFVGRAGKLLTQMIEAMSLKREDVYICNVVKCRPPENRLPEKDEIATCSPFLQRQLGVIAPKVICCLGACSAQTLLETTQGISRFRGEWFDYRGAKLIATYHPAYLLRNPAAKSEVWKDLQKVMAYLGLQPKRR
ncbi:MAG TPA: uracil-DNA glycosylase [Candidatus Acidoferrales bacterium]|jgi:DNA polymerase|nr:uracil-DNA glycosylase [Candidatus Acidoferrales bacterium]